MKWTNIKSTLGKINDDGWRITCLICAFAILYCAPYLKLHWMGVAALLVGILYEQVIEWLAHGWLQHHSCKVFNFFVQRHHRHHINTGQHHALQPIAVFLPVVLTLLAPAILWSCFSSSTVVVSLNCWLIIGFLSAHILLNILHYEIHAKKKATPLFFRKSKYYLYVKHVHMYHHQRASIKDKDKHELDYVFGIANPWVDIFLYRIGLTAWVDTHYPKFVQWLDDMIYSKDG